MRLGTIAKKIGRGDLSYALGRFRIVRRGYSLLRSMQERSSNAAVPGASIFENIDVGLAVDTVRRDAVFTGLSLPKPVVSDIVDFCCREPLFARHDPNGGTFMRDDIINGRRPDGRAAPMGAIADPLRCESVRQVLNDPILQAIARRYLGYAPRKILTLLYWSFASQFSDEERRRYLQHVIDYHYDVGGYNFVYASFYLLPTVRSTGAHVMIKGSHRGKSLPMLLGSAVATPDKLYRHFGRHREFVIEGPAGAGFIQDSSCYHRASPPTHGDRLLLQFRFS